MSFTGAELIALMESWVWPFCRVVGLVMAAPVSGAAFVPVRIRLVLALAITLVMAPAIPLPAIIDPLSAAGLLVTGQQLLIGATLGLAVRIVFVVVELAGQIVAQQMGLGFAAMVDPQHGVQVPVVSQFYVLVSTLVFLGLNGHLVLVRVLAESFRTLPVGTWGITRDGLWGMVSWAGWLLANAVLIALPVMTALLVINLAFAVLNRAAPQLNIFSVGFPLTILSGMGVMVFMFNGFEPHFSRLLDQSLGLARTLIAGP